MFAIAAEVTITKTPNVSTLTCTEPTVTLTATGADSYVWSNGATTASIEVS